MRAVPLARSVAACVLLLLALCADFVWGALYHGAHAPLVLAMVLLCYAALLYALAGLVARLAGLATALWLCDFAMLLLAAYLALNTVRRLTADASGVPLPLWSKALLVLAVAAGAAWLLRRADAALRARLAYAGAGAALLFVLTPPLMVALSAPPTLFPLAAAGPGAQPVLVLLLDELGAEAADPVVAALERRGLGVSRAAIAPLGANTVNVIPALLTGRDFSAAQACSLSAICSGANILDFARMRSAEPRLDLVGFHHPYCRIGGLRYCYQAQTPSIANPFLWFGCAALKALVRYSPGACERGLLSVEQVNHARDALAGATARAPFWRDGGVLYVHHPLPHPPGRRAGASLDADYAANIVDATAMVDALVARLEARFGQRYALVISSDHPLRPAVWCAMARYADACALRPAFRGKQVPLLVAAPGRAPPLAAGAGLFAVAAALRASPPARALPASSP